ncbi:hypothetical protein [Sphingomicrobium astaxanthinifaciens]|uniref:hypothetical protein n=1 Tax=Sphingomicrobium astaxanthinifaciens TaxID=1227949 RepID=UPI001FCA5588|nr:hypothetical protein [Sphingomicrobium astaxanthinifaciens]MCJ7421976.1 hypothetical protein [Sphingomicrobium astaxanthinifaciens]
MKRLMLAAGLAAATMWATPAAAQDWPMTPGSYWEVTGIDIDDGHMLDYANWLASSWKRGQEFAKQQGWIKGYHILNNVHARHDEPDIYIVTIFDDMVSPEEGERRRKAFQQHMERTAAQLQQESGQRATFRHVGSTVLLRDMVFK